MVDSSELHTETFTNSQGWTVVRVTHVPSGVFAERERSQQLASSVQAQSECIAELRDSVGRTSPVEVTPDDEAPVSRAEFEALAARVAALESQLGH